MIWDSVVLMTLIDLAVIGLTAYVGYTFYKSRVAAKLMGIRHYATLILCGLLVVSIFYFADLLTMHVLPYFMPQKNAMAIMTTLHLNWHWLVNLISIVVIAAGMLLLGRKLFPLYSNLKSDGLRFQDIAANVPGIVYQFQLYPDGTRRFPYVSPNVTDLLGLDPIEIMDNAETWLAIVHPDDLPELETSLVESAKNMTRWFCEGRMIRQQNGEVMWFRGSSEPQKLPDGSILWNGIVLDITEHKQVENMSLRIGRLMRQSANEIYIFDDKTLKFIEVSQGALDNLGYSKEEMRSLTPVDLKAEFTREDFETMIQPLRSGEINRLLFETPHTRKDGSTYPAEVNLQYAGEESPPVFMAVIQNGAERKETIEALRQAHDKLEQRVLERTTKLAKSESRQRQAKQEAERANNIKTEFLSRMSHELRTSLNAIFGFAQLIQTNEEEPLSQTQEHDIAEIIKASQQLLEMINQLLDLSRIEGGEVDQDIKIINVSDLVADYVYQISRSVASAKQITIRNQILDPDLYLLADPSCFRQIMTNLISNAIKYNHDGGTVTIKCAPSIRKTWLRIQISDTGSGISQNQILKLFKPFERLSARDTEIEGIGIGLSVTKLLVEAMGGNIGVDSTPGQGSTFWFELPLTQNTAAVPNRAAEVLPLARSKPHHLKVLYIEDNPSNLKLVREYLELHKHITMITARTAELGLELAETQLPDLILMDIGLPGIDGYQALEILQTVEATRNIPVVAISANALPTDIEKGLAAGFKTYLTKPINLEQLTDTIEQVLAA